MKQADVFNIIKDKSGRVYSRREIDHVIKLLFPGVVKKPMKIAKNEPHKDGGQKDQRKKRYPFASITAPRPFTTVTAHCAPSRKYINK